MTCKNGEWKTMEHHTLDIHPIPDDKTTLYINEPWFVDQTLLEYPPHIEPEEQEDNIRIYVPIDLNKKAILRRLNKIICKYGEANEDNESDFRTDVYMIISQLEVYDQIWYTRHMPEEGEHSKEGIALAGEIVEYLEEIPDGCAESFPFELIDELKHDFGLE